MINTIIVTNWNILQDTITYLAEIWTDQILALHLPKTIKVGYKIPYEDKIKHIK